jgi:hypothetical protein
LLILCCHLAAASLKKSSVKAGASPISEISEISGPPIVSKAIYISSKLKTPTIGVDRAVAVFLQEQSDFR